MNARKVVEPVCLDVLLKWRGDEETGRDQMDEILREVVVITDSEEGTDSSEDESSEEEGEITSPSSHEGISQRDINGQATSLARRAAGAAAIHPIFNISDNRVPSKANKLEQLKKSRAQRGFKRYQAAWNQAMSRRDDPAHKPAGLPLRPADNIPPRSPRATFTSPSLGFYLNQEPSAHHTPNTDAPRVSQSKLIPKVCPTCHAANHSNCVRWQY